VLGFENSLQFYNVGTVEFSKHFDLIQQELPVDGILRIYSVCFRKSFNCELLPITSPLNLIHSGESSGIYFFDGKIEFIEAVLINIFCEIFQPDIQKCLVCEVKPNICYFFFDNFQPYFFTEISFFL
jgi:hypothetical protein